MANWFRDAVVYEIYPQSFNDTNGDGIGDLPGVIEKLDYVRDLGFNAIWLNPINPSAFNDGGYDVTDFYDVAPRYGTLADYRVLCEQAHARGIRVILDLVAGHTSNQHPWFLQSAKREKNAYTNRYIWTDNVFDTGEGIVGYTEREAGYIPNFFWSQPALNYGYAHPDPNKPWQLPVTHPDCVATKRELMNIIDFWMDQGTDGFRVDLAPSLIKGDTDGSFIRALWQEIRAHMESRNPDCLLLSEWGDPARAIAAGFHCDFLLHSYTPAYTSLFRYEPGTNVIGAWTGTSYFRREGKGDIRIYLDHLEEQRKQIGDRGYIGMITGNHDLPRLAYGRTQQELKTAMVFQFTMPGVPFVYYGDEIGIDHFPKLPSKEGGYCRTGARTPMQWDDTKNHGFSTADDPYLPTDSRPGAPTVAAQQADPESLLSLVKKLTRLHRECPALHADADLRVLLADYPVVYERSAEGQTLLIAVNPSDRSVSLDGYPVGKTLLAESATLDDGQLNMSGISYLIAAL